MKKVYDLETLLKIGTKLLSYDKCTVWKEKGGYSIEVHYMLTAQKQDREYIETLHAKDFYKDDAQREAIAKRLDAVQRDILYPLMDN